MHFLTLLSDAELSATVGEMELDDGDSEGDSDSDADKGDVIQTKAFDFCSVTLTNLYFHYCHWVDMTSQILRKVLLTKSCE